jgi:N-acyl-D-glutamate deacylase
MKRLTALLRVLVPTPVMATSAIAAEYDVVINNGRVMDPETNFDGSHLQDELPARQVF